VKNLKNNIMIKTINVHLVPSPNGSVTIIETRGILEDGFMFRGTASGRNGEFPNDVLTVVNESLKDAIKNLDNTYIKP
jgi:hypothetical protein